ncbi:MAG TPA: hypothetical protein VI796_02385 [Candidatus Thermoplasmatota archaeon]|nr:hypothetical protein [Candidatus Thermoplasmatota archaeon]
MDRGLEAASSGRDALERLAGLEPPSVQAMTGNGPHPEGVARALRFLKDSLGEEDRVERVLDLMGSRIHGEIPDQSPERRGALLTLLVARGVARRHEPVHFDGRAVEELVPRP